MNRDGIDHINLYSRGQTELGRSLSNFARALIRLPDDGSFDSVEGYWYWLRTGDNRLRNLSGFAAKKLGKSLQGTTNLSEKEFQGKIAVALKAKVEQHPRIRKMLVNSSLPFKHYYVHGDKIVPAGFEWWVQLWENIRTELQIGRSY